MNRLIWFDFSLSPFPYDTTHILYFFTYMIVFSPFKTDSKIKVLLDGPRSFGSSCKMDLGLWDCFGRENLIIADLHICGKYCGNFGGINPWAQLLKALLA